MHADESWRVGEYSGGVTAYGILREELAGFFFLH